DGGGDSPDAQDTAGGHDTAADEPAEHRPFAHLPEQGGNAREVTEPGQARLACYAQRGPGLAGVEAEIVAQVVEPGDIIQAAQAEVGAEQGNRLVLQRADDGLADLVHVDVAAGDHTARHAARPYLTAAGQDSLAHGFAAEGCRT